MGEVTEVSSLLKEWGLKDLVETFKGKCNNLFSDVILEYLHEVVLLI